MKFGLLLTSTLSAISAASAADWECQLWSGGPGHAGLKQIHSDFNRLFGNRALKIGGLQCYVASCRGLDFALCNGAGVTRQEHSNARNIARDTDPGQSSNCIIYPTPSDGYQRYRYGRTGEVNYSLNPRNDIRRC